MLVTLFDKFGRQITDLRISVTDRCNFRCVYCRSADPENYQAMEKILSWGVLDLSMTTNGHLLAERCERLLAAGLHRINISLDSLDPLKFEKITRTHSY